MKLTKYLAGIIICALSLQFYFQTQAQALKIGDPVPDLLLEKLVNYPESSVHLSSFDDKLVILDFWETWCAPCVKGLPHMQQLQAQFDGQLQVLLVSTQPKATIAPFLNKIDISLPSLTDGKFLNELFPHKFVPYQVWLKDGKVFALTTHESVTEENIREVISGKLNALPEMTFNFNYDPQKPLLLDGNGGTTADLQYRSLITGYIDGIGAGGVSTDSLGHFKVRALNASFLQLYLSVFRLGQSSPLGRINRCIVEPEVAKLLPPKNLPEYATEARDKYFCYELIVPKNSRAAANDLMMQDLNRFFGALYGIEAKVEKRTVTCWALRKLPDAEAKLLSHSSETQNTLNDSGVRSCHKLPFAQFVKALGFLYRNSPYPVADQTGITADIDIDYPTREEDISRFGDYLRKYGLYLQQEPCEIEMLVIQKIDL